MYLSTGNSNVAVGGQTLSNLTTGSNNIGIGNSAQVPSATGSNQVRIGDANISYAGIQVAWSITSDKRWKSNIATSELGLEFIKSLNPVSYTRINDKSSKIEYGFIAQDIEQSLLKSGAVNTGILTKDDEGMYSVRYNDFFAPIVKSIQEQQLIIESDKTKISALEEVNKQLELRLQALEAKTGK